MRSVAHSGFLWKFVGGFVVGAIGIVALNPAQAETVTSAIAAQVAR